MKSSNSFLEAAIPHLEPLLDEVIFIGGSVVSLYITDPAALYVRPTLDIDILSAATTYSAYQSIVDKLIAIGFSHDIRGPLCRFVKEGLVVDLMSPDESVLGFSNHWYRQALATPQRHQLSSGLSIRIPNPPLMLATKLAAFEARGKTDPAISKDLDDIVTLIDGRAELLLEIPQSSPELHAYTATHLTAIATHKIVRHILPGLFLGPDSEARHERFHHRVLTIANIPQ